MNTNTRPLAANYTMEVSQDLINLNDEIESALAEELQKEINNEVVNELMGATLINSGYIYKKCLTEIPDEWANAHIEYEYKNYGMHWYFKSKSDAAMFTLKWL